MKRYNLHPVALILGLICFFLGANVAAFWSQEFWGLFSQPPAEETQRAPEKRAKKGLKPEDRLRPFEPSGPEPPYDEFLRRPRSDDGELSPAYRNLPDRCGSIRTKDGASERTFPPAKTDYEVDIRGDLAAVTVEQSFVNPTDSTIDAVYQFPLNRLAAVYGMTMRIGDRVVRAKIEKKEEAQEIFDRANRQGKKAALLSQQRPNWFTQRVANIEPEQTIEVELHYVHPLPKEDGAYQFVVPTMLGKRYGSGASTQNDLVLGDGDSQALPQFSGRASDRARAKSGQPDVSLHVRLDAPMPVDNLRSTSHPVRLRRYSKTDWRIDLGERQKPVDEHFRLEFELSDAKPRAGLNAFWDDERSKGYFSLLLEPPRRPKPQVVSNREIVFVMDTSGSMGGRRLQASKKFVKTALRGLRRIRDSFRIVRFSSNASEFSEDPVKADDDTVERAISYVDNLHAGGGTEYGPGIERALKPKTPEGSVRLVIFLTDGYVGYEYEVLGQLKKQIGDARLYGIGIGQASNRYLLEEMGRMGRGFARFLTPKGSGKSELGIDEQIERTVKRIESPVMTHLRVDWGGLGASSISPNPVPDLFAGESVRVHGTYSNPGRHTVTIHGTIGPERVSIPITFDFPETESDGRAVKLTWARQHIRENMHNLLGAKIRRGKGPSPDKFRRRIVELGLRHSLTTQWTSLIAVSDSGEKEAATEVGQSPGSTYGGAGRKGNRFGKGSVSGRGFGGLGIRGQGRGGGGFAAKMHGVGRGSASGGAIGTGAKMIKRKTPAPKLEAAKPKVTGSLSKNIIQKVIKQHRREMKYCYEKRLRTKPKLAGKVVLQFTVAPSGDVKSVAVKSSTASDDKLESCMKKRAQKWTFPAVKGGGTVKVNYPYVFSKD